MEQNWLIHLDKILAGLTVLSLLAEEWAHAPWYVPLILAVATFISEFFKPPAVAVVQSPPGPKGAK